MKTKFLGVLLVIAIVLLIFNLFSILINIKTEMSFQKEQQYKSTIDSLNFVIHEQETQIEDLFDDLQMKESEISYWGRKYESERDKK